VIKMWIKCENEATEEIYYDGFMDEPANFSDNGKVQVKKNVGKKLTDKVGAIKPVEKDTKDYKTKSNKKKSKGDE